MWRKGNLPSRHPSHIRGHPPPPPEETTKLPHPREASGPISNCYTATLPSAHSTPLLAQDVSHSTCMSRLRAGVVPHPILAITYLAGKEHLTPIGHRKCKSCPRRTTPCSLIQCVTLPACPLAYRAGTVPSDL